MRNCWFNWFLIEAVNSVSAWTISLLQAGSWYASRLWAGEPSSASQCISCRVQIVHLSWFRTPKDQILGKVHRRDAERTCDSLSHSVCSIFYLFCSFLHYQLWIRWLRCNSDSRSAAVSYGIVDDTCSNTTTGCVGSCEDMVVIQTIMHGNPIVVAFSLSVEHFCSRSCHMLCFIFKNY